MDGGGTGDVFRWVDAAIVEHENFVRGCGSIKRNAHIDALVLQINLHPEGLPGSPVDAVPGRLYLLRNLPWLAACRVVQPLAICDYRPILAHGHAVDGERPYLP